MIFDPFLLPFQLYPKYNTWGHRGRGESTGNPRRYRIKIRISSIRIVSRQFSIFFQRRRLKREISFLFRRIILENFKFSLDNSVETFLRSNSSTMIFDCFFFSKYNAWGHRGRRESTGNPRRYRIRIRIVARQFSFPKSFSRDPVIKKENFFSSLFHFNYIQSTTVEAMEGEENQPEIRDRVSVQ